MTGERITTGWIMYLRETNPIGSRRYKRIDEIVPDADTAATKTFKTHKGNI